MLVSSIIPQFISFTIPESIKVIAVPLEPPKSDRSPDYLPKSERSPHSQKAIAFPHPQTAN
ncbi:MAG: hypothetical protein IM537_20465 [Pseudanabaena sp. M57BS1SP1A06MG]|nr:hypothetical protein [Pseudanabaena sp. M38BS1SP1A06MG]MCA6602517.1 hypothetical protein [Pseudanabaena sp. M57BS1SP1A06MG]